MKSQTKIEIQFTIALVKTGNKNKVLIKGMVWETVKNLFSLGKFKLNLLTEGIKMRPSFKAFRQNRAGNVYHSYETFLERLIHDIDKARSESEEKHRKMCLKEERKLINKIKRGIIHES